MGEIRSPYFSIDQEHLKDNAEIRSPYFSSGGDYLGVNAEIRSPYFSFDTQYYHGDNAGIHSSYFSAADYHGEDAEIPSGTFFHQDNIVENPYKIILLRIHTMQKILLSSILFKTRTTQKSSFNKQKLKNCTRILKLELYIKWGKI
jgi:hypothetical protein